MSRRKTNISSPDGAPITIKEEDPDGFSSQNTNSRTLNDSRKFENSVKEEEDIANMCIIDNDKSNINTVSLLTEQKEEQKEGKTFSDGKNVSFSNINNNNSTGTGIGRCTGTWYQYWYLYSYHNQ